MDGILAVQIVSVKRREMGIYAFGDISEEVPVGGYGVISSIAGHYYFSH
jgi:hypothetical protein